MDVAEVTDAEAGWTNETSANEVSLALASGARAMNALVSAIATMPSGVRRAVKARAH
jgi:hypothetical protein